MYVLAIQPSRYGSPKATDYLESALFCCPFMTTSKLIGSGWRIRSVERREAGLTPAVNMDTGYANLISESERRHVLELAREVLLDGAFVAGAFVSDNPGDAFNRDAYLRQIESIQSCGGTPIIFQSFGLTEQAGEEVVAAYAELSEATDGFIAFELGTMFAPFGAIYDKSTYEGLMRIKKMSWRKTFLAQPSVGMGAFGLAR